MTGLSGSIRRLTEHASVLVAPNAGPMTLDGTNSYVLSVAGSTSTSTSTSASASASGAASRTAPAIVVDPGPDDPAHLAGLAEAGLVELILITHRHHDHTAGALALAELTGAPVRAADPVHCVDAEPLRDGEIVSAAGVSLTVRATPGHTTDSVCFLLGGDGPTGSILTGDTILGRGTTVIAHPDGRLGAYLDSLRLLVGLGNPLVLPGHGPVVPDLAAVSGQYLAHREQRLAAVREAVRVIGADASVQAVTDAVYTDIDSSVRPAAERSVAAQLDYLRDEREAGVGRA